MENPKFWRWAIFKIDKENIREVLHSQRLKIVTAATLECSGDISPDGLDSFIQFYIHLSHMLRTKDAIKFQLKYLRISANLEEEETREALAEVICNVEEVDLSESDIQSTDLLEKIASYQDLRLKHLALNNNYISEFPEYLVSKSLRKIEEVNLSNSGVRTIQLNQLFEDLQADFPDGPYPLKRLDLSHNDLSYFFQPAGLCQLEELRLSRLEFKYWPDETLASVLSAIAESSQVRLKLLDLSDNNLSHVPASSLAEAAIKLEKFSVSRTKISPGKITELFSRLRDRPDSRLKSLNVSNIRLTSISPGVLSDVVCRLEEAHLANTRLNTDQVTAIFSEILTTVPLTLKHLNVSHNNLSSLTLPTLKQALARLEEINLVSCRLNLHHVLSLDLKDFAQKYM